MARGPSQKKSGDAARARRRRDAIPLEQARGPAPKTDMWGNPMETPSTKRPSKSERAAARKTGTPEPVKPMTRTQHFDIGRSGWDSRGNYQATSRMGSRGWSPGGAWYG